MVETTYTGLECDSIVAAFARQVMRGDRLANTYVTKR